MSVARQPQAGEIWLHHHPHCKNDFAKWRIIKPLKESETCYRAKGELLDVNWNGSTDPDWGYGELVQVYKDGSANWEVLDEPPTTRVKCACNRGFCLVDDYLCQRCRAALEK